MDYHHQTTFAQSGDWRLVVVCTFFTKFIWPEAINWCARVSNFVENSMFSTKLNLGNISKFSTLKISNTMPDFVLIWKMTILETLIWCPSNLRRSKRSNSFKKNKSAAVKKIQLLRGGECLQKSWILDNELQFRPLSSCLRGALGVVNLFWCSLDNMISR